MKERAVKTALLVAIIFFMFIALRQVSTMPSKLATPSEGVADLTAFSFATDLVQVKERDWAYYPGQLYTPADFAAENTAAPQYGNNNATAQYGTYRLLLQLTPHQLYAISGKSFSFSQRLYIGGVLMEEIGIPGPSRSETTAASKTYYYTFLPQTETVEIIFQVANFNHRQGGRNRPFYIASPETIYRYRMLEAIGNNMFIGVFLTAFFYFGGMHLFFTKRRHFLYLALACLMLAVRMLFIGEKHIMVLFPQLRWLTAMRIEYITNMGFVAFLQLYMAALYPGMLPKPFVKAVVGISGLCALIVLFGDSLFFTKMLPFYVPVWVLACVITLFKMLPQLRKKELHTSLIFAGLMVFACSAIFDELSYMLIFKVRLYTTLDAGMLACLFLNMIALTLEFLEMERVLIETEKQREDLDETNRLLDRLVQVKSQFMADISHELRTPLTVMSANAQLSKALLQADAGTDEIGSSLDVITSEASRMARMVSGMLEVSNLQTTRQTMAAVNLSAILLKCGEAHRAILEKKGNRLHTTVPHNLPLVWGSGDMLTQLVLNLLSNSARHTENGVVSIHAGWQDDRIYVSVTDTGEGIDPLLLGKVFERHVRAENGSYGLGLPICREIIELHGGTITIQSKQGVGTTATFTIPINHKEVPA